MKKILYLLLFSAFINYSCTPKQEPEAAEPAVETKNDTYFHYSIWWAFVNKVFDAQLSVADMKKNGNTGLGSFNMLNGEMVMLDGVAYRITQDGKVTEGAPGDTIVYANAAFFEKEFSFELDKPGIGFDTLKSMVTKKLPSPNFFHVVLIHGTFAKLKLGGLHKQDRPFKEGLDVLIPARPVFESTNVTGTMVGFYCPEFVGNMATKGFHFHFISDTKDFGGHVMELETSGKLTGEVDRKADIHFVLPDNDDFANVGFDKEFQYKKD